MLVYSGGGCVKLLKRNQHSREWFGNGHLMKDWDINLVNFLNEFQETYNGYLCLDNGANYSGDIYISLKEHDSQNHLHVFRNQSNSKQIIFRNKLEKQKYYLPLTKISQKKMFRLLSKKSQLQSQPRTQKHHHQTHHLTTKTHSRSRSKNSRKSLSSQKSSTLKIRHAQF